MDDKKVGLPFGWIVKQSKTYPDRVYYFNVNSGASSWEFPDLLQQYVNGNVKTTVAPVLTATSLVADALSPERLPVPTCTTSPLQATQQPSSLKQFNLSENTCRDSRRGDDDNFKKKWSAGQETLYPSETQNRKSMKPHTLSQLKCRQRLHNEDETIQSRSENFENNITDQSKIQNQTSNARNVCKYSEMASKVVKSEHENLPCEKKGDSAQINVCNNCYTRPGCKGQVSSENGLQQILKSYSQQSSKTLQSVTSKLPASSYSKQVVSKAISPGNYKPKSTKLSPIKYPTKCAGNAKDTKNCAKKDREYSKSANNDSRTVVNIGKRFHENTEETSSIKIPLSDFQASKRRKTQTEILSANDIKHEKNVNSSEETSTRIKKKTQVNYEKSSADTYTYVAEDKRRVVRSSHSQDSINNLAKNKPNTCTNKKTSEISKKLTLLSDDSNVSRSVSKQYVGKERMPELDEESDFDRNNNAEYKLFKGDKDKLLSIQAWINNLQDKAGSESPSVDSYSQVSLGQVNDSVDSGYVTNTPIKACSPPEKGWPGEKKEADITSRAVVCMEVDDYLVDEKVAIGRDYGDLWKLPGVINTALPSQDGVLSTGHGGTLPATVGGDVTSGGGRASSRGENEEEVMDIDEVLIEVRQQVSGSRNENTSSFLDYTDKFTPMKSNYKIITVVVDTNILISNLGLFDTLKDYHLEGKDSAKLCLFIPWIVLRELDALKEKKSLAGKARHAVSMLKTLFSSKHPRVKGQTPKEADEASNNFQSTCNDDDILQACLQCQKNGLSVMLLTNDNNLINKALVSGVSAYTAKDIFTGLNEFDKDMFNGKAMGAVNNGNCSTQVTCVLEVNPNIKCTDMIENNESLGGGKSATVRQEMTVFDKPQQTCLANKISKEESTSTIETLVDDMYCKMKTVLHEALGEILEVEMQKAYDDIWKDIVYRKPPWDLVAILECWKKHWRAVFGFVFPRCLSENVDRLLHNISRCITLTVVTDICEDSSVILEKAAFRKTYSSRVWEILKTVELMKDLCGKIPEMTTASLPSLTHYLDSQVDAAVTIDTNTGLANDNSILQTSQCTASTSVINTPKPHTSHSVPHSSVDNQTGTLQTFSSQNFQSGAFQPFSCQNLQTGSQINPSVSSVSCEKFVANASESGTSPELMAGEHLSQIWRCIYKYCDEFYRTISTNSDPGALGNIEPVLKVLVSTSLELRKYYAGLLELPVSDLKNREEEFTALSQVCNTFISKLNVQEEVPVRIVTPLQLLVLYSKPTYRETLTQFLSQLDEMLKMMYQCLHKLCPDD